MNFQFKWGILSYLGFKFSIWVLHGVVKGLNLSYTEWYLVFKSEWKSNELVDSGNYQLTLPENRPTWYPFNLTYPGTNQIGSYPVWFSDSEAPVHDEPFSFYFHG